MFFSARIRVPNCALVGRYLFRAEEAKASNFLFQPQEQRWMELTGSSPSFLTIRTCCTSTARLPEINKIRPDLKTHEQLYRFSVEEPAEFWGAEAKSTLTWMEDFDQVMDCDVKEGKFKWFKNGKLNASVNCIDRHLVTRSDKVALIWEKDEPGQQEFITYKELSDLVNRMGNLLRSHGVKKGNIVAIYMPVCPMTVATMLACSRIGAIHSVVFAGFSAQALASRIQDMSAVAVVTANEGLRGGKIIPLRKTVSDALDNNACPTVKNVFVMERTENNDVIESADIRLSEALKQMSATCNPEPMDSEDYLFVLYTSGSTGTPKGIAHSTGGYLLYTAFTHKHVFGYYDTNDIFGCVADIGWITGHSYVVYGPLVNGGTSLLFESTPNYPDPGRYWETVQRLGINQFYGSPTAVRLLLRHDDSYVTKYDRTSLKLIGIAGEPMTHEAWDWLHRVVGEKRCDIVDTWWQTETGGAAISPRPSEIGEQLIPGKPMKPLFGLQPVLLDEKGQEIEGNDVSGSLCMKGAWPGIARTVFGNHQRFIQTYLTTYPGYFFAGDGAHRDENGYYQITGRVDDVINVTGHRLGTAEVEDVMDDHKLVAESAVVGFPHPVKGEGVYAYVVVKEVAANMTPKEEEELANQLRAMVKQKISGFAVPEMIQFCTGLPKTRSGKIMRRILRKVAADQPDDLGDITTLSDPSIVSEIIENHNSMKK